MMKAGCNGRSRACLPVYICPPHRLSARHKARRATLPRERNDWLEAKTRVRGCVVTAARFRLLAEYVSPLAGAALPGQSGLVGQILHEPAGEVMSEMVLSGPVLVATRRRRRCVGPGA